MLQIKRYGYLLSDLINIMLSILLLFAYFYHFLCVLYFACILKYGWRKIPKHICKVKVNEFFMLFKTRVIKKYFLENSCKNTVKCIAFFSIIYIDIHIKFAYF